MRVNDIVHRISNIEVGTPTLFIADCDFDFKGLPILKDSLVWYDGRNSIKVNMIDYGIFQSSNVPQIVTSALPQRPALVGQGIPWHYLVDKTGDCPKEETRLPVGWRGVWHGDHFDTWSGSFADHVDRISSLPSLELLGIRFSPLTYTFDVKHGQLNYFLTRDTCTISLYEHQLNVPDMHEVEVDVAKRKSCFVRPIAKKHDGNREEFDYMGIPFRGLITIDDKGLLTGSLAREIVVKELGSVGQIPTTVPEDFSVSVAPNGDISLRYASNNTMKVETHRVRLLGR